MWVRSQDKDCLVDVKGFAIIDYCSFDYSSYGDYYSNKEPKYETVGISVDGKRWSLGTYNTEKKAMEILDKLENRIIGVEGGVFQMPEDE